ncbi:MAG: hypothetical protein JWM92_3 [Candidatus Nomurabacteria bacterium]|jgi:hypothetical protein|nr:hypothetical protein [Candidatus Nomurabacteria bacterium]
MERGMLRVKLVHSLTLKKINMKNMKVVFRHGRPGHPLERLSTGEGIVMLIAFLSMAGLMAFRYSVQYQGFIEAGSLYDMRRILSLWGIPIMMMAGVMYHWSDKNNLPERTLRVFRGIICIGGAWFALGMLWAILSK